MLLVRGYADEWPAHGLGLVEASSASYCYYGAGYLVFVMSTTAARYVSCELGFK
jgi:hypothetical protein